MNRILRTGTLIGVSFREQFMAEKAYLGNFWFGLLNKLIFNTMFLLFIDQLFARVGQFAGYTKNDFLFLFFTSQLGFYLCYYGIFFPMQKLVETVRNGSFDLLLLKPVPHRAFLYISGMHFYELALTAAPSLLIIAWLIDWSALVVTPASFALGLIVWLSGIVICNTLVFTMALPVFKQGEATDLLNRLFYNVTAMSQMPYSKLPMFMKIAALIIFPQILIAGAASETLLGKGDMLGTALLVGGVAIVSAIVAQWLWKYALRNYTSVSS
jgi:ABC-2 type transport system permease protein